MHTIPLKAYWDLLAKHIQPQRVRFVLLTVLLLSSTGLQIVNPQIVRSLIDSATSGQGARYGLSPPPPRGRTRTQYEQISRAKVWYNLHSIGPGHPFPDR